MSRAVLEEIARQARKVLAPALSGEARYTALLIAKAAETEARALSHPPAPPEPGLSAAIRAGAHDGDMALHARLRDDARQRAWIAEPSSVA